MESERVPVNRGGGVFNSAKNVKLHPNDFSIEDKMASLSEAEKAAVDDYTSRARMLLSVGATPNSVDVVTQQDHNLSPVERAWEEHYQKSAHHFPLKNYIIHAFPQLRKFIYADEADEGNETPSILECGCGTGSTLIPLMLECTNQKCRFSGFDISESALSRFKAHEGAEKMLKEGRLTVFRFPPAPPDEAPPLKSRRLESSASTSDEPVSLGAVIESVLGRRESFDAIPLIFVLSALPTVDGMIKLLKELHSVLKPGGVVLFRDHALPDHNFFRFISKLPSEDSQSIPLFFRKGDGTTQFFFVPEFTDSLFAAAGFKRDKTDESTMQMHCTRIENRKNGKRMDKIFINSVFYRS